MACTGTGACNQGRQPWCCYCGTLITDNSDGSSPHAETRDTVDTVLGAVLDVVALLAVCALGVGLFKLAG